MQVQIEFLKPFIFTTNIPVNISDIGCGGQLSSESILSMLKLARLRYLKQWHFSDMNAGGCGLLLTNSIIQYEQEAYFGDYLKVELSVDNIDPTSFDIYYKISTTRNKMLVTIAYAKTGLTCYNYHEKRVVTMPEELAEKLELNLESPVVYFE